MFLEGNSRALSGSFSNHFKHPPSLRLRHRTPPMPPSRRLRHYPHPPSRRPRRQVPPISLSSSRISPSTMSTSSSLFHILHLNVSISTPSSRIYHPDIFLHVAAKRSSSMLWALC